MTKIEIARQNAQYRFEAEQDNARRALESIQRSATQALAEFDQGGFGRTDFISQKAATYAESLAKMDAISNQLAMLEWLAKDEEN